MLTTLFWNVHNKPILDAVAALAMDHEVDILVLAQNRMPASSILGRLNRASLGFQRPFSNCGHVEVLTRFSPKFLVALSESDRYSIRRLHLPARLPLTLVFAHLPSKIDFSTDSQSFELFNLVKEIERVELQTGHSHTVVLGDLNANPFDPGVVAAGGLHGVMTKDLARKGKRVVQGREHLFFYNPMWSLFGERQEGPPGTHFYRKAEALCYFWNIFDQVLIRPALIDKLRMAPRILTKAGSLSLVANDGTPDSDRFSDHLPVLFQLEV